jgi:hypothetical protein
LAENKPILSFLPALDPDTTHPVIPSVARDLC